MKSSDPYLRVGVTGGIGSGKSVVCRAFARLGRVVLLADEIARALTESSERIKAAIRTKFGDGVFLPDGTLNRSALAARVFSSPSKLKTLNAIVHPYVFGEIERRLDELPAAAKCPYVLIEAALIFESGMDKQLDYVIVVHAEQEERIRRVMERDGVPRADVLARMKSQMNVQQALRRADFIIANDGSVEDLERQVTFLDSLLQKLARA